MPFKKICQNEKCGKEFMARESDRKFCSKECVDISKTIRKEKECEYCHKEFMPIKMSRRFCSNKCSGLYQTKDNRVSKVCPICNNNFNLGKSKEERIFCSWECYNINLKNNIKPKELRIKNISRLYNSEMIECACGCGKLMSRYDKRGREKRFINHHIFTILHENRKGIPSWNKGLTKETNESVLRVSLAKLGDKNPMKREEIREKNSLSQLRTWGNGRIGWNKGLKGYKIPKASETKKRLFAEGKLKPYWTGKIREDISGENNNMWQGGISFEDYPKEFNKRFKEAIKIRDSFLCLKCSMREEDAKILFKKGLHIHHIDYIKKNTIKENCCVLCTRCNAEVNSNREHWTKFFQSMLSERYGYKYSEDGKVILNFNSIKNEQ